MCVCVGGGGGGIKLYLGGVGIFKREAVKLTPSLCPAECTWFLVQGGKCQPMHVEVSNRSAIFPKAE